MEELEQAVAECMALHQPTSFEAFAHVMIRDYECELADALGADEERIMAYLDKAFKGAKSEIHAQKHAR